MHANVYNNSLLTWETTYQIKFDLTVMLFGSNIAYNYETSIEVLSILADITKIKTQLA